MIKNKDILNNFVCSHPFEYIDVQYTSDYVCCPSWCPTGIREENKMSWYSNNAIDIRKSVIDGTYRHCDHSICPSLNQLLNTGKKPYNFYTKEEFENIYNIKTPEDVYSFNRGPEEILFGWDRSCNFRCPSCRVDLISNDKIGSEEHNKKLVILKQVEKQFGPYLKKILVTGSGDPFYSNIYRDFLINFDKTKYPVLEKIQIITNGRMLTKKMWSQLKAAPYTKQIEISIDAGTKNTYENITRIGGSWDILIQNLKFLSTVNTLKQVTLSMVVSEQNFKEMHTFYKLMHKIFQKSKYWVAINFRQHVYWDTGKYTEAEVEDMQVFKKDHPLFNDFKNEVFKIHGRQAVSHNFHHLLKDSLIH